MAGKIFVTGDCHNDFRRFSTEKFPEQSQLDKDDCVIICGDFGGIWAYGQESENEQYWLQWLDDKNYMTLFVDGNHENFERLNRYPIKEWHGGLVHEIRPSVLHLMRGQIYNIAGKKIFAFGGASSHDISGGILDKEDPEFERKKAIADKGWKPYRIRHYSWWEEELPNAIEYDIAKKNLELADYKVDYIISHCCASKCQDLMMPNGEFVADELTDFFDLVRDKCEFTKWYFGHYHMNYTVSEKEVLLYETILPIGEVIEYKTYVPGRPKYQRFDKVEFWWNSWEQKLRLSGKILVVDRWGSYERTDESSYDICAFYNGEEIIFTHVPETNVIGYVKK